MPLSPTSCSLCSGALYTFILVPGSWECLTCKGRNTILQVSAYKGNISSDWNCLQCTPSDVESGMNLGLHQTRLFSHKFHQLAKASSVPVRKGAGGFGSSDRTSPEVGVPSIKRVGGCGNSDRTSQEGTSLQGKGLGAVGTVTGHPQEGISLQYKGLGALGTVTEHPQKWVSLQGKGLGAVGAVTGHPRSGCPFNTKGWGLWLQGGCLLQDTLLGHTLPALASPCPRALQGH